ncbi:hypothetical protein Hanom_Chr10g00908801 [Helianthus anomalus]
MPTELTVSGYIIAVKSWVFPNEEIEATTRAAHDDSAYDPNRSDPIPAMSPTLSPTLSAITCNILPYHIISFPENTNDREAFLFRLHIYCNGGNFDPYTYERADLGCILSQTGQKILAKSGTGYVCQTR